MLWFVGVPLEELDIPRRPTPWMEVMRNDTHSLCYATEVRNLESILSRSSPSTTLYYATEVRNLESILSRSSPSTTRMDMAGKPT